MELATIVHQYKDRYVTKYGDTAQPAQLQAMHAILRCRTPESGELYIRCPDCDHAEWRPVSCGNRNCPKCQNHTTSQWIDKQQEKLLPVPYFMVTFTLPYQLRSLARSHQKEMYTILFRCASSTLKDFGLNPKKLGAELGMTMVLHTNSRKLDFHPHIHAVVPGGGIDRRRGYWKRTKGNYLFRDRSLAKVFRARLLQACADIGLSVPKGVPHKWVVDCSKAGKGISALKYLSRYLYRGVISEKHIISNTNGQITFKYIESRSKKIKFRKLDGEDFLHLILQHVLPSGFRRVRDYGFLHGNAKKMRSLIQLILRVIIERVIPRSRPNFNCRHCKAEMIIVKFRGHNTAPG